MSITISFTGDTPNQIRAEALNFFNGSSADSMQPPVAATESALPDDKGALVARAKELGVEGVSKRMSVENLQKAVASAEAAAASSPEPEPDPFDGSAPLEPENEDPFSLDEPEPEEKPATKEDVRTALVNYQTAVKEKLIEDGEAEDKAAKQAMNTARSLLKKVGDADNLGGLDEAKFDKVVKAAEKAKSEL